MPPIGCDFCSSMASMIHQLERSGYPHPIIPSSFLTAPVLHSDFPAHPLFLTSQRLPHFLRQFLHAEGFLSEAGTFFDHTAFGDDVGRVALYEQALEAWPGFKKPP